MALWMRVRWSTYLTRTENNLLRHVSYQGQRQDKAASEVVRSIEHA